MFRALGVVKMDESNPLGVTNTHVSLGLAALAATVMRARMSRTKRPWSHVLLDAIATAILVWMAYHGLAVVPEKYGGPIPHDIALFGATVTGILGWESAVRVARRVLGIQVT